MRFIKRVFRDIKNLHHIEVYALSFVSFVVACIWPFIEIINQEMINMCHFRRTWYAGTQYINTPK